MCYSMASLRERIYVEKSNDFNMCGVLIYTASSDSEGTLGGLIAQGKDPTGSTRYLALTPEGVKTAKELLK